MKAITNIRQHLGRADADGRDEGFTLVEILIAIVLVGVLSAVVVVGISSLTDKGSKSACQASLDAARAGAVVYYATNSNTYPATITAMTTGNSPALTLPSGVTVNSAAVTTPQGATTPPAAAIGMQATSGSWWMNMTAGSATSAPTFVCVP